MKDVVKDEAVSGCKAEFGVWVARKVDNRPLYEVFKVAVGIRCEGSDM